MVVDLCKNYKVILLGNSSVGKTSIMNNFSKKHQDVSPTIGAEFCLMKSSKYNHKLQIFSSFYCVAFLLIFINC